MQLVFCKRRFLLAALLLFSVQLLPITSASGATAVGEIQIAHVATSYRGQAPCDPACPGGEGLVCDPATKCSNSRVDKIKLAQESKILSSTKSPPQQDTKAQPARDRFLESMQFVVVRSSSVGCEPTCPEWISAMGKITSDSPRLLRKILKNLGKKRLPVVIDSPGGDVNAAIEIGRMIRKRGMDVAVGKTGFDTCTVALAKCRSNKFADGSTAGFLAQGNAYCYSACPFILAGGARRLLGLTAEVGVHQIMSSYKPPAKLIERDRYVVRNGKRTLVRETIATGYWGTMVAPETSDTYRHELMAYFRQMGTDPWIVDRMFATPASDIAVLSYLEMTTSKIITGAGEVMSAHICDPQVKAYNCIELKAD
jgi:hypothetical protein